MLVLAMLSAMPLNFVESPVRTIVISLIWFAIFGSTAVYLDYDMRRKYGGYKTTTESVLCWSIVGGLGLVALAGLVNAFWPIILTAYTAS